LALNFPLGYSNALTLFCVLVNSLLESIILVCLKSISFLFLLVSIRRAVSFFSSSVVLPIPLMVLGAVIFMVSELLIPFTLESWMVSMYFELILSLMVPILVTALRTVVPLMIRVSSIFLLLSSFLLVSIFCMGVSSSSKIASSGKLNWESSKSLMTLSNFLG